MLPDFFNIIIRGALKMSEKFSRVPSIYPKLIELRKSKTAEFKTNKYLKPETKLRYYQVVGALHMLLLNRMVLGDACGIGKTIELITTYTFLLDMDSSLKMIVLCPKSATFQWKEEFEKFTIGISCRVIVNEYAGLNGYSARMAQYKQFQENVLIMGYTPLLDEYEIVKTTLGSNYMVCFDECHAFKGRKTKTFFACQSLAESSQRVYGLSATIIKNSLEEVWSIYAVIVPGLFGNITSFNKMFCEQKLMKLRINGKDRYIPKTTGYKNLTQFKQLIDPYILARKKEDVATELPELISRKVILEMEPDQKELYRKALAGVIYEEKIKREFFEVFDKVRAGATDEKTTALYNERREKYEKYLTEDGKKRGKLAALVYCQMISNGPRLINDPHESSKEIEFERLISEELLTEKILVFTRFKSGIHILESICERCKVQYTKITGDVLTTQERDQARLRFQNDPECRIMFITTAGSASLNLQSAGVIIFYDTPWSYGDLVQTIGRAQRIGSIQEHILLLHLLNKGTIDMRVMNRVSKKKGLSDEILGDTAKGALVFTENDDTIDGLYQELLEDAENVKM
jgi:SNF2 family DNA or RNA helicase